MNEKHQTQWSFCFSDQCSDVPTNADKKENQLWVKMVAIIAIQDLRDPGVTVGDKGSPTSLAFNHLPDVTLPRGMQLKFASYLSEGCIVHNLQTIRTFLSFKFNSSFEYLVSSYALFHSKSILNFKTSDTHEFEPFFLCKK